MSTITPDEKASAINQALFADPVDLDALRELALSPGGLLRSELRARAWPKLLELDRYDARYADAGFVRARACGDPDQPERDIIDRDVARSLSHWDVTRGWTARHREKRRKSLSAVRVPPAAPRATYSVRLPRRAPLVPS